MSQRKVKVGHLQKRSLHQFHFLFICTGWFMIHDKLQLTNFSLLFNNLGYTNFNDCVKN